VSDRNRDVQLGAERTARFIHNARQEFKTSAPKRRAVNLRLLAASKVRGYNMHAQIEPVLEPVLGLEVIEPETGKRGLDEKRVLPRKRRG